MMRTPLPRSIDDLRGLRAARWSRESTGRQFDRYGPEAQHEQQDRAIEKYGLVDSGLSWSVAHSGRTINRTGEWGEMVEAAGRAYDVLVVGYVSRFARDLRTAVNARHDLHAAGASMLFADERVLSSDEDAWEVWAREAVEAEAYSRRLGKRIREGYAAKFRRLADQAGNPPLGFVRVDEARVLAIDPDAIERAVAVFERYATGTISYERLAEEAGIGEEQVTKMLKNPLYNGWVRRHRGAQEERMPAPWRDSPPVSDELWERVADLRSRRHRAGGTPKLGRVDLLRGLLYCTCGQRIRTDGTMGTPPRTRKLHPRHEGCPAWGAQASYSSRTWEAAIIEQVRKVRHDGATIARIVSVLHKPAERPSTTTRPRIERRKRELAMDVAEGRIDDATYLARMHALRAEAASDDAEPSSPGVVTAKDVTYYLSDLARLWDDLPEPERAELLSGVYERIVVRGPKFESVRLTPRAYSMGLALALPEWVKAPPAGFEPATFRLEGGCSVH